MPADPGSAVFFPSANKSKKFGGLGVNKRNRGYPAYFEFIERPLKKKTLQYKVQTRNQQGVGKLSGLPPFFEFGKYDYFSQVTTLTDIREDPERQMGPC